MSTFNPKDQEVIEPQKNSFGVNDQLVEQPATPTTPSPQIGTGPIERSTPQMNEQPGKGRAERYLFEASGQTRKPQGMFNKLFGLSTPNIYSAAPQGLRDRFKEALEITRKDIPNAHKIRQIKKLIPSAKFRADKENGQWMVKLPGVKNEMPIFKASDEGYKEFSLPSWANSGHENINPSFADSPQGKLNAVMNLIKQGRARLNIYKNMKKFGTVPVNRSPQEFNLDLEQLKQLKSIDNNLDPKHFVGVAQDVWGRPVMVVKRAFLHYKPGVYYFDKPGLTGREFTEGFKGLLKELIPTIGVSTMTGGMGLAPGVLGAITTGGIAKHNIEKEKEKAGIEGYSRKKVAFFAGLMGLGEVGGRVLGHYMAKLFSKGKAINQNVKVLDDNGQISDDFVKALYDKGMTIDDFLNQVKSGLKLSKNEAKIFDDFVKTGNTPTKGQLSGHSREKAKELGISGMKDGEKLQQKFLAQDQNMFKALDDLQSGSGGSLPNTIGGADDDFTSIAATSAKSGSNVQKALSKISEGERKTGNKILSGPEIEAAGGIQVNAVDFMRKIKPLLDDYLEVLPAGFIRRIKTIQETGQVTFKDIQLMDDIVRRAGKGTADGEKLYAIGQAKSVLREIMGTGTAKTKQASDLFKKAMDILNKRSKDFGSTEIKSILKENPDGTFAFSKSKVIDFLVKGKPETITKVKELLLRTKEGKAAWNDLRQQTIKKLIEAAKGDKIPVKHEGTEAIYSFSGRTFKSALDELGTKINTVFTQSEIKTLKSLSRVGELKSISKRYTPYSIKGPFLVNVADAILRLPGAQHYAGWLSGALRFFGKESTHKTINKATEKALMTKAIEKIGKKAMKNKKPIKRLTLPKAIPLGVSGSGN